MFYGKNAKYYAPNKYGYYTPKGYVLLTENRHWIRNGKLFTAPENAPKGIDYNKVNSLASEAESFNKNSIDTQENYMNTWGDRSNICSSGILMQRDGDLRWGGFEVSFSFEQKLFSPITHGTISGSVVYTDSGEGGAFLSAGPDSADL